jgi:flagellar hook-length control protein FliK
LESQQTEKLEESVLYTTEGDTISQVRTGIEQKLDSEDTEFVIKLKPEGLGEITVEMARRNGRIELNLIASSSETEKLLSGSIERLRESLRVYNADIARVGFSQPETQPYAFLTDHSAFSYSEESQRQWRSSEDHRRVNAQGSAEAVSKVSELGTEPVLGYERSLLNRYA